MISTSSSSSTAIDVFAVTSRSVVGERTDLPLGWGTTIDLIASDIADFYERVRECGCLITRIPSEAADGRYGFVFQIPDAGY